MNAGEIMTRSVTTLRQDASLGEAVSLMLDRGISGLPIVDGDRRLVGVLTEGDLLRRVELGTSERHRSGWWEMLRGTGLNADEYIHTHSRRVGDLMTADPVTVTESTSIGAVVDLMERRRIKRLPVVRDGEVVGVVSRADLLRAVDARLKARTAGADDDVSTLRRLHAELDHQPWFVPRDVTIVVKDGFVTLGGTVSTERAREALEVAARNLSGANTVRDEVRVVETIVGLSGTGL